jgi:hypothetical protein
MLAMNFLGATKLSSINDSYINKIEFKPSEISQNNPLLTNSNSRFVDEANNSVNIGKDILVVTHIKPYIEATVIGESYPQETDGSSWWYWVEKDIRFKLTPYLISDEISKTKVQFEYATRSPQTLVTRILRNDGTSMTFSVMSQDDKHHLFQKILDIPPTQLARIEISSDGKAFQLGPRDPRLATWIIRNLEITTETP